MDTQDRAGSSMNDSGTGKEIGTQLTQNRSPGVLGWTYFVRVDDAIKIGSASNFKDRLSALQTAHERPLDVLAVLPASLVDEYKAHQLFAHLRIRGEWFKAEQDLLYFIEQAKLDAKNEPEPEIRKPPPRVPKVKPAPSHHQVIRRLINVRAGSYGADTPAGHLCSNLAVALKNMETYVRPEWAKHESQTLPYSIQRMTEQLARITQ